MKQLESDDKQIKSSSENQILRNLMMLIFILTIGTLTTICYGEPSQSTCQGFPLYINMSKESELMDCISRNYSRRIRPVHELNQTVQINISFYQVAVAQVYDKENAVLLETNVEQRWYDHRLTWNPDDYAGIKKIFVNYWNIWEPELIVWDNLDEHTVIEGKKVVITYKGEVEWIAQMRLNSYCWMDFARFPFDSQTCHFYLQHHIFDKDLVSVNVVYPNNKIMPGGTCYSLQDEWNINNCEIEVGEGVWRDMNTSYMVMSISMERQHSYHYYLVVLPSVLIVILTLSLFWLPHENNQRFISAGCVMCMIFLLNFVLQQFLPPGLSNVPVIASYLLYAASLVIMTAVLSLVTRNLHFKDPREEVVPEIIKKILLNSIVGKVTFLTTSMPKHFPQENKSWNEPFQGGKPFSPESGGQGLGTNSFMQNKENLLDDIRKYLTILTLPSTTKRVFNEWKQLALAIDRLSFYILFLLNIIISFSIYFT